MRGKLNWTSHCLTEHVTKQLSSAWVETSWAHLRENTLTKNNFRFLKNFHNLEYPLTCQIHSLRWFLGELNERRGKQKYWCFEWLHCHLTPSIQLPNVWILPLLVGTAKYGLCEFSIRLQLMYITNVDVILYQTAQWMFGNALEAWRSPVKVGNWYLGVPYPHLGNCTKYVVAPVRRYTVKSDAGFLCKTLRRYCRAWSQSNL